MPPGPAAAAAVRVGHHERPRLRALEVSRGGVKNVGSDGDCSRSSSPTAVKHACTVHGYPTLTMRDGNGRNMGESADL